MNILEEVSDQRVAELEAEGMTHSDAIGVAMGEVMHQRTQGPCRSRSIIVYAEVTTLYRLSFDASELSEEKAVELVQAMDGETVRRNGVAVASCLEEIRLGGNEK